MVSHMSLTLRHDTTSPMSPLRSTRYILPLLLGFAACSETPTDPVIVRPLEPVVLQEIGHGQIRSRYTAELWVRGGIAYTTTWGRREALGNTFFIWNVDQPQPQLVDSVRVDDAATLGDVQVSDDGSLLAIAFENGAAGGGLGLYSLADPRSPKAIARVDPGVGVHTAELARVNGRLYAFMSLNPTFSVPGTPARLMVVDVTDPTAPVEVLDREMGRPVVHDVFVRDGYLFTALWDEGLAIWDIGAEGGSPGDPRRLGTVKTVGGNVHNVWWVHDPVSGVKRYALVGEEGPGSASRGTSSGDVHVVDVSDKRNPVEVAFYTVQGAGTHNFWVDEARGVLYAAYYNGGVRALDLRGDLADCAADERDSLGRCDLRLAGREVGIGLADVPSFVWGVQQVGDRLYASDMHAGLRVLDLAALYAALER